MTKQREIQQKSRLGTLLVHKGLISRQQLNQALDIQASSQLRLGEILVSHGWISEHDLKHALRKQSTYRMVAAVGAFMLGPIQPFIASAHATPLTLEKSVEHRGGLQAMNDLAMSHVSAQGIADNLNYLVGATNGEGPKGELGETTFMTTLQSLFPAMQFLSDYTISDVEYFDDGKPAMNINDDGSISLKLPKRIGEIAFRNLQIAGPSSAPLGDLVLKNVRISEGSSVTINVRH
ncbi:MAG: hypothetical protein P1U57_09635 [Oleibacter sp.]|nr:hypothetical protein [Thalassolituus sp.]